MAASRDLKLRLLLEDKASGQFKKVDARLEGSGAKFKKFASVAQFAMGGVAAKAVLGFVGDMDRLATTAEAVQRRFDTVFGDMADSVSKWVDAQNEAFGMSETELKSMAAGVQDLLVPMGFARSEAAGMTEEILTLGNALSEWTGGQVASVDAVDRLRKGILGEREGLKELGVKISEADVKQQLLKNHTDKLTGSALEQAKAQATLELITGKSTDALSAYSAAADSALRQNKEMTATAADLKQELADSLKPALDDARDSLSDVALAMQAINSLFGDNADAADEAAKGNRTLFDSLVNMIPGVEQALTVFGFAADKYRDQKAAADEAATAQDRLHDSWVSIVQPGEDLVGTLEDINYDTDAMTEAFGSTRAPMRDFSDGIQGLSERLDEFGTKVEDTATSVVDVFDPLPDQIETSLDELGDNMLDWLVRMDEWKAGLKLLAARGMSDLADVFREQGPASLDVLNEALADPGKAAVLNQTMRRIGEIAGKNFGGGLAAALEASLESSLRDAAEKVAAFGGDLNPYLNRTSGRPDPAGDRRVISKLARDLDNYNRERAS